MLKAEAGTSKSLISYSSAIGKRTALIFDCDVKVCMSNILKSTFNSKSGCFSQNLHLFITEKAINLTKIVGTTLTNLPETVKDMEEVE